MSNYFNDKTFTVEEGIKRQTKDLAEWETKLIPEVYANL